VKLTNAKTNCNSYTGKDREGRRPRDRVRDEVEVELNIVEIKS
jgi:hypothetical protein